MPICRVLIVDDQRDVRRMLRAALETLVSGIQLTDVPSGEEAILVISRQPVDVLIADVRLPGISGLELIERARVRNPNLRLVLITGMTDEKIRRQVELARADAFFFKPISIGSFLNTMQDLLGILPGQAPATSPLLQTKPEDTRPVHPRQEPAAPPIPVIRSKSPGQRIQDAAIALRSSMAAACVVIVNPAGEQIAQDGRLPVETPEWKPALQAAIGLLAAPSNPTQGWTFLPGAALAVVIGRISAQSAFVVAAPYSAWRSIPIAQAADRIAAAAAEVRTAEALVSAKPLPGEPPISKPPAPGPAKPVSTPAAISFATESVILATEDTDEDGLLPNLDELFKNIGEKPLKPTDIDAFWDTAAEDQSAGSAEKGGLSYEQARRLGLAPDED